MLSNKEISWLVHRNSVVFPYFSIPAIVIGFVYRELAIGYLNTGRDLRRMESNTRSPIFSDFGEILEGIVTVRAFSAEKRFLDNLHVKIDMTTKVELYPVPSSDSLLSIWPSRCGIISGWRTAGFYWTLMLWGVWLSWLRCCFLYRLWRTKLVLRVYVSRVQWHLQTQVNGNLLSAFFTC